MRAYQLLYTYTYSASSTDQYKAIKKALKHARKLHPSGVVLSITTDSAFEDDDLIYSTIVTVEDIYV